MNSDRLQQDHPCVIDTIRRLYLHPPAARDIPYVLNAPTKVDPSAGQAASISKHLKNQVKITHLTKTSFQYFLYNRFLLLNLRRVDFLSNVALWTENILAIRSTWKEVLIGMEY